MKPWKLAAFCLIGLFPTVGRADDPTTQPVNPPAANEYRPWDRGDRIRGGYELPRYFRGYGFRNRGDLTPTTNEWEDITSFMKEHSPERLKALNSLPEGRSRSALVALATRNYRNLVRARNEQPEIAQLMINRVELEDLIFKLTNQIKSEKGSGDHQQAKVDREVLHQKVSELLDMNIKERQLRIAQLEKTLKNEQAQLAEDSKNRDQLVERRLNVFLGDVLQGRPTTQP